MRFKSLKDKWGVTRIKRKFLWWPKQFNNGDIRWLEFANILERVEGRYIGCDENGSRYFWMEIGFADEMEK